MYSNNIYKNIKVLYKNFITLFIINFDLLILMFVKYKSGKDIMLIRVDGIGDFLVWLPSAIKLRNFYQSKRITLIVNEECAELVKLMGIFDEIIAINSKKFQGNLFYRTKMLLLIARIGADVGIQTSYSRTILLRDSLVRATKAKARIGSSCNLENIKKWEINLSNSWYTKILDTTPGLINEIDRNNEFLLGLGIEQKDPFYFDIPVFSKSKHVNNFDGNYFIIFPGASWYGRRWPIESFAVVANLISKKYNLKIMICGGGDDVDIADDLIKLLVKDDVINMTGITTVLELIELIRGAKILIANETSAIHIASAVNTKSVCVLGGGHFGRFMPSTAEKKESQVSVFKNMDCFNCNWNCIYTIKKNNPAPCVLNVCQDDVILAVNKLMDRS